MAKVKKTVTLPYSCEAMFKLVDDIEQYPMFVPWCDASQILKRSPEQVCASLTFGFRGIHYTFTTENCLLPYDRMDIQLVDGPFDHLQGHWYFKPLADGWSEISLELEYVFSFVFLSSLFEPFFTSMAHQWVQAFVKRAEEVYGPH